MPTARRKTAVVAVAVAAAASLSLLMLPHTPGGPGLPGASPGSGPVLAHPARDTGQRGGRARAQLAADVRAHGAIPQAQRDKVLGPGWATSADVAVTASGDGNGFHVLTARERTGYQWHTVATLSEPGLNAAQWVGNTCTTPDGRYEAAVYAPRRWADQGDTMRRGAFAAVVDLDSGKVTKLGFTASLAYFDPGCGTGDEAVFTRFSTQDTTQLVEVDTATGRTTATVDVPAEVTSAVPAPGGAVLAAEDGRVVRIGAGGAVSTVAATPGGVPLRIHPSVDGGAVYLATSRSGSREAVQETSDGRTRTLAQGPVGAFGLSAGARGTVFVTGSPRLAGGAPGVVASTAPAGAAMSAEGHLAVTAAAPVPLMDADPVTRGGKQHPDPAEILGRLPAGSVLPVAVRATAVHSGTAVEFDADPQAAGAHAAGGAAASPASPRPAAPPPNGRAKGAHAAAAAVDAGYVTPADDSTDTVDEGHYCAVPRNDPGVMVYQPTPNQVEWAVDRAVMGELTSGHVARPAGWHDSGLPAWSPQGMFPLPALSTGGHIPPQVLLGVLAQESNLWEANSHAEPGEFANPLIGNYYGANVYPGTTGYSAHGIWTINWDKADCGYGIGQVTDGMRVPAHPKPNETELPAAEQKAVAVDYATNIAYAARLLAEKWNELHQPGQSITINNDDPSKIENWFAAVWDYNEGLNAPGAGANWGLGWLNNPANPIYPADRGPFLDQNISCDLGSPQAPATGWPLCSQSDAIKVTDGYSPKDAAKPQNWPYQEKVVGWAAESIDTGRSYDNNDHRQQPGDPGFSTMGFSTAWWTTEADRITAKPPLSAFCDSSNACDPSSPPQCEVQHLGSSCDPPHWFHQANVTWKSNCASTCGNDHFTFVNAYPAELPDAQPVTPPCGPPGGTVVDELSASAAQPACPGGGTWTDGGSFHFTFTAVELPGDNPAGQYQAKEDLEQDSSGFGGHYWFAHTRDPGAAWDAAPMGLTGEWDPKLAEHLYQVQAYLPYLGGMTPAAEYHVYDGSGNEYTRTVDQSKTMNGWTTVGYFQLGPGAKVTLSNTTHDGDTGNHTVAFDALRFEPIAGNWVHHTFDAVSTINPDQNLDTDTPASFNPSPLRTRQTLYDWAQQKISALEALPACTAGPTSSCIGADTLAAVKSWATQVQQAGTATSGPYSEARWMGFANPLPPSTIDANHSFTNDLDYKFKTHVDVSFAAGGDGKIIPGSQQAAVSWRTGNTALAPFVKDFVNATVHDYGGDGISLPDLSYTEHDANVADGTDTQVANPFVTGWMPARAYLAHADTPAIDSSGGCLSVRAVGGGVDAYRPLGGAPSTNANFGAYVSGLQAAQKAGKVPQAVVDMGNDIYDMLFKTLQTLSDGKIVDGSVLYGAPPIWQQLTTGFCANGSLKSEATVPDSDDSPEQNLVQQGYMPDLYLYYDGHMVNESGQPATGPVQSGNFADFSNIPGINATRGYAFDYCDITQRGNGGNPWNIGAPLPVIGPSVNVIPRRLRFCDVDEYYETANP